jgi:small subunit ribosomal protein S27e
MDMDLINVDPREEERQHKLKRLVQAPKSFFMDVKSQCGNITTIFSHSQTPIYCTESGQLLALPTGGRVKLMEGVAFRRKGD